MALSELVGLGLIDRLWADRTVRAIFVNGPKAVFVERNGLVEAAGEVFRDEAHLVALLGRLVARPASGVAEFTLRDGSVGTVIFPPAAPMGPVLTLRRGEPGTATLERLVRSGMLAPAIADLLRIAARSGLDMLVSGPEGSGKTALLAAIARDLDGVARVVTVARHRQFRWAAPSKVELWSRRASPFPVVLAAAARLQPSLLVLNSIRLEDYRRWASVCCVASAAPWRHSRPMRWRRPGAVGRSRGAAGSRPRRPVRAPFRWRMPTASRCSFTTTAVSPRDGGAGLRSARAGQGYGEALARILR